MADGDVGVHLCASCGFLVGDQGACKSAESAINSTAMMEREHAENMDLMGHDHNALEVARLMGGA